MTTLLKNFKDKIKDLVLKVIQSFKEVLSSIMLMGLIILTFNFFGFTLIDKTYISLSLFAQIFVVVIILLVILEVFKFLLKLKRKSDNKEFSNQYNDYIKNVITMTNFLALLLQTNLNDTKTKFVCTVLNVILFLLGHIINKQNSKSIDRELEEFKTNIKSCIVEILNPSKSDDITIVNIKNLLSTVFSESNFDLLKKMKNGCKIASLLNDPSIQRCNIVLKNDNNLSFDKINKFKKIIREISLCLEE